MSSLVIRIPAATVMRHLRVARPRFASAWPWLCPGRATPLAAHKCLASAALAILVTAMAAGCETSAPQARRAGAEIVPCAERLHEICGHLLLYYSINGKLPERLADLKSTGPEPLPPLACPDSGKPYIYNRAGLAVPGRPGRLVLYDGGPCHSGMRWGILADVAADEQPLTTRVVPLPETPVFSANKQ